jgi:hypothetical protein
MISKNWSRKLIAACLSVAVVSLYSMAVLASPGAKAATAQLSIAGQVTVNGEKAISGGTFFSDGVIATSEKSSATVNIAKVGRVELAPNSSLKLIFTDNSIAGMLDSGSAQVSTLAGVTVNLTTKDGSVIVDGSQATLFTVTVEKGNTALSTQFGLAQLHVGSLVKQVAAGESAMAGTPTTEKDPPKKLSGGALAAFLAAVGAAAAAALYAAMHNNDLNFGGTVVDVSPQK